MVLCPLSKFPFLEFELVFENGFEIVDVIKIIH